MICTTLLLAMATGAVAGAAQAAVDTYALEQKGDELRAGLRLDQAAIAYRRALRDRPDDFALLLKLADTEHLLGRNAEALEILQRAVKIVPDDAQAYVLMGRIYWAEGKRIDARIAYQKAVIIEPDNIAARLGLAAAIRSLGDEQGADSEMEAIRAGEGREAR